jgi:cytochrome c oxidase assembly protein subunit 15
MGTLSYQSLSHTGRRLGPDQYNGPLHWLAVLTVLATFPLIFMGGLVTTHGAGLSVPDWPNSFGYNMFLFPPSQWVGGIFYEHTHRLMGTVVGFLSLLLVGWALWSERRGLRLWLSLAVLIGVIFQGILGGLRVIWTNLDLAIVHACFAQAFFCLAASAAIVSSRWWVEMGGARGSSAALSESYGRGHSSRGRTLLILAAGSVFIIYLQLIIGAMMRHFGAGLAIPDLPLAYGHWLPPMNHGQLAPDNAFRAFTLNMDPVTLGQVWLHFLHRIGAVLVTISLLLTTVYTFWRHRDHPRLWRPALLLIGLLAVQITLGVLTVLYRKPADITSAHVATGALVLVTAFTLLLRAAHLYPLAGRINFPGSVSANPVVLLPTSVTRSAEANPISMQ